MLEILEQFFATDTFWQQFVQESSSTRPGTIRAVYRYRQHGYNIRLTFFELDGLVKSVEVVADRRKVVEGLYFLTLEELRLLLNRVPSIRAANSLCSGSESIVALSASSQEPS